MEEFIYYLIDKIGYLTLIKAKDSVLFLAGISIGSMMMSFWMGRLFFKIRKVENLEDATYIKIKTDKGEYNYISPETYGEAVEILLTLTFIPFVGRKQYTIKNKKRTKLLVRILKTIWVLMIVLGILFISFTITPRP